MEFTESNKTPDIIADLREKLNLLEKQLNDFIAKTEDKGKSIPVQEKTSSLKGKK